MRHLKRTRDLFARLGGEEFALVLPSTSKENAAAVAQRIWDALNKEQHNRSIPSYTSSIGVCSHRFGETDRGVERDVLAALFKNADEAVYRAKGSGRNRIEVV